MRKHLLLGLLFAFLLGGSSAWAVQPTGGQSYEVPVPVGMASPIYHQLSPEEALRALPGWNAFTSTRGQGWFVATYRDDIGAPSTLMGPSFPLVDPTADEQTVREATLRFVTEQAGVLKVDPKQIQISEILPLDTHRQEILFGQTYQGLEVVGGRVEVYLYDGRLHMMGAEFYPGIQIGTVPALTTEEAKTAAAAGIPFNPATDSYEGSPRLVVYPMILQGAPTYFLAYEVRFKTDSPVGLWWTYVDAADGQILSRTNNADSFDIPTTVLADVQLNYEFDPFTEIPNADEAVRVNSQNFYTDASGFVNLTVPLNQPYTVTSQLSGRWVNVNRADGSDASWSGTGNPGIPLNIKWDGGNSHPAERDAYYSTNRIHSFIKSIDPTFTGLDFSLNCNVNLSGSCNAFWNGSSINFYAAGGGCVNMAQISDVVMHEYGHGITQYTYSPSAPPTGSGMGEGFSDVVAMTVTNDYLMGRGINNGTGYIRTGLNTRQYPGTECGGEVHCLGEILMGPMWKTRGNFINTYGYSAGKAAYDQIMRTAWKTKQYSIPNYLTRLLMADDNNGDLGDGTPNWYDICDAFAIHNLPCPAITKYIRFTNTPLADQTSTTTPYEVVSLIEAINCGTLLTDSLKVNYSTNGGQTWASAPLTAAGPPNQYHGYIPAQSCGTLVSYYLRARTSTGVIGTDPLRAPRNVHMFMTGPNQVSLSDDFETDHGWTIGAPGDGATSGVWERVDPVGKVNPYSGQVVQPEDDHTQAPGTRCFVTDGRGGYYTNYNVDGGATTILSPIFDFTADRGAANIEFWAFLANEIQIDDTLRCSVSNDAGTTWTDLVKIYGGHENLWKYYKLYISSDDLAFTNQMRFRFKVADYNSSLTEAAIDDVVIRHSDCVGTDVGDGASLPTRFEVEQNQPNPLSGRTTIRFALPAAGPVAVDLFDASGRLMRRLANGPMSAGLHSVVWDGTDGGGRPAASGVYYYRVQAGSQQETRKMMLVK